MEAYRSTGNAALQAVSLQVAEQSSRMESSVTLHRLEQPSFPPASPSLSNTRPTRGNPSPTALSLDAPPDPATLVRSSFVLLLLRNNGSLSSGLTAPGPGDTNGTAYYHYAIGATATITAETTATGGGDSLSEDEAPAPWMAIVGVLLGIIILSAVVGNGLVVTAVMCFRRLRSVTNYFVVSLAVADIAVAVLVMPYSLLYEVYGRWRFGWAFCYFWISCDVTCCTASILHLCVISLDRYLAITSPLTYKSRMSKRRAVLAICLVWTCSGAISFVPIYLGWFADTSQVRLYVDGPDCGLHVNKVYAVVSATTSFYVPLVVMLFVYSRIYRIASNQAKEIDRLERSVQSVTASSATSVSAGGNGGGGESKRVRLKRASKKINKDFKALKTLGTLMGVFCVSWLPFFLMYLITPFCSDCHVPAPAVSAITWLGYANSCINPCVYAYLNRDFRMAFRKLLFCTGDRGCCPFNLLCCHRQAAIDGQEFIENECSGPHVSGQNNVSLAVPLRDM